MVKAPNCAACVAVVVAALACCSCGKDEKPSAQVNDLKQQLSSPYRPARFKAIAEMKGLGQVAPRDVVELFQATLLLEDIDQLYVASHILPGYPRSDEAVALAERLVQSGRDPKDVAVALVYLQKHAPEAFAKYFESKQKLDDIPPPVRQLLSSSDPIVKLVGQYEAQVIADYLRWQPPPGSPDAPNPYRETIVALGGGDRGKHIAAMLSAAVPVDRKNEPAITKLLAEILSH
jgi:hypothetical protein